VKTTDCLFFSSLSALYNADRTECAEAANSERQSTRGTERERERYQEKSTSIKVPSIVSRAVSIEQIQSRQTMVLLIRVPVPKLIYCSSLHGQRVHVQLLVGFQDTSKNHQPP
jgi:hypothetical protein